MKPSQVEPIIRNGCYKINVNGDEYMACEQFADIMWSASKPTAYGKGIIEKPQLIGKLAEMAYAKYNDLDVDLEYRKFGDKHDFFVGDKSIDIKTSPRLNRRFGLIYYKNSNGNIIPLNKDIYIFSLIVNDEQNKTATVGFIGYITKEEILTNKRIRIADSLSRKSNHQNYEIDYDILTPMEHLSEKSISNIR